MLYSFSAKSRIVFICHVDLWTISKEKSPTRNSTRALFGTIYFPLIRTAKMRFCRIYEAFYIIAPRIFPSSRVTTHLDLFLEM